MFIGQPTSAYGNDVEITVDVGTTSFFHYEESTFYLTIPANVTTNAEEGIYEIQITLKEETISTNFTTTLLLTILPVDDTFWTNDESSVDLEEVA